MRGKIVCELARSNCKGFCEKHQGFFSFLIRISHMLVAGGNFPPSCKLQPVGESLLLFICRKQGREEFFVCFVGVFVSSWCHPYLSEMFLLMLSADKLLTTQFLRLA